jgi:hypothetical protein
MTSPSSTEEILEAPTSTKRRLTLDKVTQWYTEEEAEKLMFPKYKHRSLYAPLSTQKYAESYEQVRELLHNAEYKEKRVWSPKEDEFIRSTYAFLSDNVIGLALNVPWYVVKIRRRNLGLSKEHSINVDVIIWANRDKFDEDIQKSQLTKARPDILEHVLKRAKCGTDG